MIRVCFSFLSNLCIKQKKMSLYDIAKKWEERFGAEITGLSYNSIDFLLNRKLSDIEVITGHTPTQTIGDNPHPGYIYQRNNHIAIDCGASYPGGRLAALCLDTGKGYYSSSNIIIGSEDKEE